MRNKLLFLLFFCSMSLCFSQKTYVKNYYKNGTLKEEGWLNNSIKTAYWKFYYKNGKLKKEGRFKNNLAYKYWYFYTANSAKEKEGHFKNGMQQNWWLFYDDGGKINYKCQFKNDKKNGYCLHYKKEKLVKASKFKEGKKIKEWTDLKSFKRENNLLDLR